MDLKSFVAQTLTAIGRGVREAQEQAGEIGMQVNPYRSSAQALQDVEFDVEVSTSEAAALKSGIGVFVGAVGLGTQGAHEDLAKNVGRIRFRVPVELPSHPKAKS